MPHCCPQKQQCVLTRRSGSTEVESRTPVIDERCGPNRSMMCRSSTGSVAIRDLRRYLWSSVSFGRVEMLSPERALSQTKQRAPALRANLLIVRAAVHLVREPELAFDRSEILNH